jgi:heme/copper-type cytochrome/quinol oxidase subunit 2
MAIVFTENIFTLPISGIVFVLDETYGLNTVSIVLTAGAGTVEGSMVCPNGAVSSKVTLVVNQPVTFSASSNSVLTGLIIDATGGDISLVAK